MNDTQTPTKPRNATVAWSVHDLIRVEVDPRFPHPEEWAAHIRDVIDLEQTPAADAFTIELRRQDRLDTAGMYAIDDGMFVGPDCLLDTKLGVKLQFADAERIVLSAAHVVPEWMEWLLVLALLAKNACLVHGAAVVRDGQVVLFPAWGGVGKTALVSALVSRNGWRLLGDDLIILSADGRCRAFPKAMVLYPYHRALFPDVFARGQGPVAPSWLNTTLTRIAPTVKSMLRPVPGLLRLARRHNPQSARVAPSDVFGRDGLATAGQLHTAVWLQRVNGLAEPTCDSAGDTLPARALGSTISQFHPRCLLATNVAVGSGLLAAEHLYQRWLSILRSGLNVPRQDILQLPTDLPVAEVPRVVEQFCRLENLGQRNAA